MLWLLSCLSLPANSQDRQEVAAVDLVEAEQESQFMGLLEFLGEFDAEDGEWIDPEMLGQEAFAVLDDATEDPGVSEARPGGANDGNPLGRRNAR